MYPFPGNGKPFRKVIRPSIHDPIKISIFGNVVFIVLFHSDFSGGVTIDCFPFRNIPHPRQIFIHIIQRVSGCGGIGGGAQAALAAAGIKLYGGVSGEADQAVEDLLRDKLEFNPDIQCNHHGHHGEGHSCGEHGCGSDHHCESM